MHRVRRTVPLLLGAAVAAILALAGCAGSAPAAQGEPAGAGSSSESATQPQEDSAADPAPQGLTGQALPADWPAELLLPSGELVLVLEVGGGYQLLIEGVDEAATIALLDEMAAAGLRLTGPAEAGEGAWIAEVTGDAHSASYAYASGGAGEPNVTISAFGL